MEKPLVSVVMGCYNSEKYIRESIDSILSQTIHDIEFIIIDDCSKDDTVSIIQSYKDKRIRLILNKENRGLGYNLNYGLKISNGKYIARMDADDISLPNRFEEQIKYLEKNREVVCVGTWSKKIGEINIFTKLFSPYIKTKCDYEMLKALVLFGTPMMHPSVMFNGDIIRKEHINYDPEYRKAQDYELWSRIIWQYRLANIPKVLLHYRYSQDQASNKNRSEQVSLSNNIYKRLLKLVLKREPRQHELEIHKMIATRSQLNKEEIQDSVVWLLYLYKCICKLDIIQPDCFAHFVSDRWVAICRDSLKRKERLKGFRFLGYNRLTLSRLIKLYK